jgi:hypothetical protein
VAIYGIWMKIRVYGLFFGKRLEFHSFSGLNLKPTDLKKSIFLKKNIDLRPNGNNDKQQFPPRRNKNSVGVSYIKAPLAIQKQMRN